MEEYYKYPRSSYYIMENILDHDGQLAIMKMSPPMVFMRFDYSEGYFAGYDELMTNISVIQWLDGEPTEEEKEAILTDCWNFLAQHETEEELRYERGDYEDDY